MTKMKLVEPTKNTVMLDNMIEDYNETYAVDSEFLTKSIFDGWCSHGPSASVGVK